MQCMISWNLQFNDDLLKFFYSNWKIVNPYWPDSYP